jgi:uncharacterized protein YbaP (TraB family)
MGAALADGPFWVNIGCRLDFVHFLARKLRYSAAMLAFLKRLAAACAALASLAAPLAMAQETAPAVTAAPAVEIAKPALWKVSDADTTIYLFGTVHALPPGVDWYRGKVSEAFEGSQELVTEIVETDQTVMQQLVISKALLPEGKTLRPLLTDDRRQAFEAAMTQYGMPVAAFDKFKPWYAAIALATLPLAKEGLDAANGVDETLAAKATTLGKQHSALETAEYQLGLFDSLSADVQQRYLSEVIRTLPEVKDQLTQIIAAWKAGDAPRLAELINEDEDDPAMIETLLVGRNKHWADWIKTRLDKPGTVFVAVGAGHLSGQGSVQDQLKTRGIDTTRVQ